MYKKITNVLPLKNKLDSATINVMIKILWTLEKEALLLPNYKWKQAELSLYEPQSLPMCYQRETIAGNKKKILPVECKHLFSLYLT